MCPAPWVGVPSADMGPASRSTSGAAGDPLVPFLPLEGDAPDPVALSMWYLALSEATATEIPHDLFALWLFPASGGVVLLGPEALALDHVTVPPPSPHLLQDEVYQLEELLRRAKYASAIAVPVRGAERDLGVILLGSFARSAFGPGEALALARLAAGLLPTFTQLAESLPSAAPHAALEPVMSREALPDHLARVASEAASGPDLVRRTSGVLYPLLPHDQLEILIADPADGTLAPLSANLPRRRCGGGGGGEASDGGATVEPFQAIAARFEDAATLLVDDLTEGGQGVEWLLAGRGGGAPGRPARALLGARLEVGGTLVGHLLLASVARDAYRPDDEMTVALAARLLAPRVAGLRLLAELEALRARLGTAEPGAGPAK